MLQQSTIRLESRTTDVERQPGVTRVPKDGRAALLDCYGFREVARLVDVGATRERGVVSEQLHRNRMHDRREHARVAWRADDVHTLAFGEVAVEIGEDVQLAAAR